LSGGSCSTGCNRLGILPFCVPPIRLRFDPLGRYTPQRRRGTEGTHLCPSLSSTACFLAGQSGEEVRDKKLILDRFSRPVMSTVLLNGDWPKRGNTSTSSAGRLRRRRSRLPPDSVGCWTNLGCQYGHSSALRVHGGAASPLSASRSSLGGRSSWSCAPTTAPAGPQGPTAQITRDALLDLR